MLQYRSLAMGVLFFVFGAGATHRAAAESPAQGEAMLSGIDLQYVDHAVRPQDDVYRHLNGKWLDSFQIPPDKGSYGSFTYLDDLTQEQLRGIIDGLAGKAGADAEAHKIGDLYASFMDETRLE
jgi:putative endopeptidase